MGIILDTIFPRRCVGCRKVGRYLCLNCAQKIKINQIKDEQLGVFKYNGEIKKLIKLIKFELVTDAISELSELTSTCLLKNFPNLVAYWKQKKMTILPVPLYWQRENWRGFNQSKLIAEALGKKLKLKVDANSIIRVKKGKIQSLLQKSEKKTNLKDAFKLVGEIPKNVIIFDDVRTSGQTIAQVRKILPKNTNWFVLTIASGS